MTIANDANHVSEGLALLLEQFKGKPKIAAVLSSFLKEIQDLEVVLQSLLNSRTIDNASDSTLDLIGRIVNQPRDILTDAEYRLWLKARIIINKSSGDIGEIYKVLQLISGNFDVGTFGLVSAYPASFVATSYVANVADPVTLYNILNEMRAVTISFNYVYYISNPLFRLDIGPGYDQGHIAGIL